MSDKVQIDITHARVFARTFYRDITAYIESHQKEFDEYLQQEQGKDEQTNADKTPH